MKKTTVKGKVITGIVAVGLLSSVGAAFASSDAGTNLQSWYNAKFGKSASTVQNESGKYATDKIPALASEYNGLKSEATNSINSTKDSETAGSQSDIDSAKSEHINALTAKESEIATYMQSQFDGISQNAHTVIGVIGNQAYQYAQEDLGKHTNAKGQAALTQVNEDLTASSEEAVAELEAAIASAKLDLQEQLDTKSDATTEKIKSMVDAKIEELRGTISDKKDELVSSQQALIVAKAQELENSAKADLDAIVAGINK